MSQEQLNSTRIVHATDDMLVVALDLAPGAETKQGHKYVAFNPKQGTTTGLSVVGELAFQSGPFGQLGANGFTNEALVNIIIDRTLQVNQRFPCQENLDAVEHLRKALASFHERVAKRTERGVNDTHIV